MSYETVVERVEKAASGCARSPEEITLVAVSKERSVAAIRALYDRGHRDFGENRARELAGKVGELPSDIRWHFVGPLQSNKVRMIRDSVVLLHSMDRPSLGTAWMKGRGHPPPALLQVNIGREPQKHGVDPDDASQSWGELRTLGVPLRGLMAIPPLAERPEDSSPFFASLRELRDDIAAFDPDCVELSMGMSDDFEVAVEQGATVIRIGRAIFEEG